MAPKVYPVTYAAPPDLVITLPSSQDQLHLSLSVKCMLWCETYKRGVALLGIVLLIVVIGTIVALSGGSSDSTTSSTNPCFAYKADDFASGVSLACFRYMWGNAGCKTPVPDGYAGWYLRSPDGTKTVLCIPPHTGYLCGAGSYGMIQTSVWRCDLDYRGY